MQIVVVALVSFVLGFAVAFFLLDRYYSDKPALVIKYKAVLSHHSKNPDKGQDDNLPENKEN